MQHLEGSGTLVVCMTSGHTVLYQHGRKRASRQTADCQRTFHELSKANVV
jgi:hypothetical protein